MKQNSKFLGILSLAVFASATQTACNGPQKAATVGAAIGFVAANIYNQNRENERMSEMRNQAGAPQIPNQVAPLDPNNPIYVYRDGQRYEVVGYCETKTKTTTNWVKRASGLRESETYTYKASNCPPGTKNNGGRATAADLAPEEVAIRFGMSLASATRVVEALAAVEDNPSSTETVLKQIGLSDSDIANLMSNRMPTESGLAAVSNSLDLDIENTRDLAQTLVNAVATAQATQGADAAN